MSSGKHKRSVVFVAFTGEEAGRLGSSYFVSKLNTKQWQVMGMINIDSVGRLEKRKMTIFGTGTAYQWPFINKRLCQYFEYWSKFCCQTCRWK